MKQKRRNKMVNIYFDNGRYTIDIDGESDQVPSGYVMREVNFGPENISGSNFASFYNKSQKTYIDIDFVEYQKGEEFCFAGYLNSQGKPQGPRGGGFSIEEALQDLESSEPLF
jgi:hypothetical protein